VDHRPEPLDPAGPALPDADLPGAAAPDAALPGPVLPSAGVPLDADDGAFPPGPARQPREPLLPRAPERVDFGDGVRLTRRSMVLVALVALVPVLAAIGVAVLLSLGTGQPTDGDRGQTVSDTGDGGDVEQGGGSADGDGGSGADGGSGGGAGGGTGVAKAGLDDAGDALRSAGVRRLGSVEAAWTWRDGDTQMLVAVTRRVTRRNSNLSARAVTLRVTTVTDPQGKAKVLASSEDGGQTCARGVEMKAAVAPSAVAVKDLDGDGTREVLVTWAHACGADVQRRATVLAGPSAYLLGGQGALVAEPDPPIADWPDGYLDAASQALG
jgi:hypothetical protein